MGFHPGCIRTTRTLLLAVAVAACGSDSTSPPVVLVAVTPSASTLDVGATAALSAQVTNASVQTVTWSSANTAVATVDGSGVVTALSPGSAEIRATSTAQPTASGSATITVNTVQVTVSPATPTLDVGATVALSAQVTGATSPAVMWSSSDTTIAKVDGNGGVTAVRTGSAQIRATSAALASASGSAALTVSAVQVTVAPGPATLEVGDTARLSAVVTGAVVRTVTWATSDSLIARISATGLLTARKAGDAVITARATAVPAVAATASLRVTDSLATHLRPVRDTTLAGTVAANGLLIPAGVTVTATAGLKLEIRGRAEVRGTLMGNCVPLEVAAGGPTIITGRVVNSCAQAPAGAGPPLTITATGDLTVDGAVIESSGNVLLRDDPALTASADPFLAVAAARDRPAPGRAGATRERGSARPAAARGAGPTLTIRGATLRHLPERAASGTDGATAAAGRNGAGWSILSGGTLALAGTTRIQAQHGGHGGKANVSGSGNLTARGADGGAGGNILLKAAEQIVRVAGAPGEGAAGSAAGRENETVVTAGTAGDGGDAFMQAFAGAFALEIRSGAPGEPGLATTDVAGGLGAAVAGLQLQVNLSARPGSISLDVGPSGDATANAPATPGPVVVAQTRLLDGRRLKTWTEYVEGRSEYRLTGTLPEPSTVSIALGAPGRPNAEYPDAPSAPDIRVDVGRDSTLALRDPRLGAQINLTMGAPPVMPDGCVGTPFVSGGIGYGGGRLQLSLPYGTQATINGFNAGNGGKGSPPGAAGSPGVLNLTGDFNADGVPDVRTLTDLFPGGPPPPAAFPLSVDLDGDGRPDVFFPAPSFQPGVAGASCPTFTGGPLRFNFGAFPIGQIGPNTSVTIPIVSSSTGQEQGSFQATTPTGNLFRSSGTPIRFYFDYSSQLDMVASGALPRFTRLQILTANHRFLSASCPAVITLGDGTNSQELRITSAPTDGTMEFALQGLALQTITISFAGACSPGAFFGVTEFRFLY